MNKIIIIVFLFIAGCAAPMTAEQGLDILRAEYNPVLSRGPDLDRLEDVRNLFLDNPSEAKGKLLPLVKDDNRLVRIFAIETCAEVLPGDPELVERLKNILESDARSKSLRLAAAEALAAADDDCATDELKLFLRDDRASRRVRAMMALTRPGRKLCAKEISDLLNDREIAQIWMPVKKHFMWLFRWESQGLLEITVREAALACLSRMADMDFGWRLEDSDLEKLENACKKAGEWARSVSE